MLAKIIFYIGYFLAMWGSVASGVYFTYWIEDPQAAIACAAGCMLAGGLMMKEAFK